jgi:protein-disulfide isomerase-like protein with CxxC motif
MATVDVTHFSDPGCPWAYSASPALAVLRWRFGDGLRWRLRLIGLTEDAQQYADRGYTPLRAAKGQRRFRMYGMPFGGGTKTGLSATSPACRLVVAARLDVPELEEQVFRALQLVQFTTALPLETREALERAVARVPGAPASLVDRVEDADVREAYEADRAAARQAAGSATEAMGRHATTDGPPRFTAPSLLFRTQDGRELDAGGFQPVEAYDVCLANLEPGLERRPPATDVVEVLRAQPFAVTTREVAACMAGGLDLVDDAAAEDALLDALDAGHVARELAGDGVLWSAA